MKKKKNNKKTVNRILTLKKHSTVVHSALLQDELAENSLNFMRAEERVAHNCFFRPFNMRISLGSDWSASAPSPRAPHTRTCCCCLLLTDKKKI